METSKTELQKVLHISDYVDTVKLIKQIITIEVEANYYMVLISQKLKGKFTDFETLPKNALFCADERGLLQLS